MKYKDYLKQTSKDDAENTNIYSVLLKSLIICFVLSFLLILTYALILSFTSVSDITMPKVIQTILIISIAIASIYGGKKTKKNGWLFGMIMGLVFIILLIPVSGAFGQQFSLDKYFIVKMLMAGAVGLIGGVIGVNLR